MDAIFIDLLKAATTVCQWCRIRPEERVVVYADTARERPLVEAFYAAACATGADATLIQTARRPSQSPPPEPAVEAMRNADMVFDLASRSWLYTEANAQIMTSRTRMLQVMVGPEAVIKRPPNEKVIGRTRVVAEMLERCQQIQITSTDGTDLIVQRGTRPIQPRAGFVDAPGRWDSLGMGMVNFSPHETEVEGTVAFNGMMLLSSDHHYLVEQPFTARIEAGRIGDINVSSSDAALFADWLASFDDPGMNTVAHVGVGLDHRVGKYDYDVGWESYYGGVILALGDNASHALRGNNRAASHMDSILLGCDLAVDGQPILRGGAFVPDLGL